MPGVCQCLVRRMRGLLDLLNTPNQALTDTRGGQQTHSFAESRLECLIPTCHSHTSNREDSLALRPINYIEIYQNLLTSFKNPVLLNYQVENGVYVVKTRYLGSCLPVLYFCDQMQSPT